MWKQLTILGMLAVIVALPFVLRPKFEAGQYRPGDPVIVVITPHNEAIRHEFARAFSNWHYQHFGQGVKVEWRAAGGTTEIMRYLASEYTIAARGWWERKHGKAWPLGAIDTLTNPMPPSDPALLEIYQAFRATDDAEAFSCRMDVFFGGGENDHSTAFLQGLTVSPWPPRQAPPNLIRTPDGLDLIPRQLGGEKWRDDVVFGSVVSTFGICYNLDRLADLKTPEPTQWDDLANPAYFRQVALADPTKSGSIAKAFEMLIHQKVAQAVQHAGYSARQVAEFERLFEAHIKSNKGYRRGQLPPGVPEAYQQAVERGWLQGVALVQKIGANARYFTESSARIPIDVSGGDSAIGMAIDFFARFQAESTRGPDGRERIRYVTPVGGSSATCDPISLLRGAGGGAPDTKAQQLRRQVAVRFVQFVLSEEGQKLWTYRPGAPGGPEKYALRRLPIRRDFYPPAAPGSMSIPDGLARTAMSAWRQARSQVHARYATEDLTSPVIDPYQMAADLTYYRRWTNSHFKVHRDLIRAMCIDSSDELRDAWRAIIERGGPEKHPRAMAQLAELPKVTLKPRSARAGPEVEIPLNWRTAADIPDNYDKLEYMRLWTTFFRENYRRVKEMIERGEG